MSLMSSDQVLEEFRAAGALLEGHFILSSGRHSAIFFQKALVFTDPARTERLCRALAEKAVAALGPVDVIVSPAVGAIIPGYETARAIGVRAVFVERENGAFALRRGFRIEPGERVLVVEDVVTTGLSVRETLASIAGMGHLAGVACLIDRSGGTAEIGAPLVSLAAVNAPSFAPDAIPPELAAIPAVKPGSRHLAGAPSE